MRWELADEREDPAAHVPAAAASAGDVATLAAAAALGGAGIDAEDPDAVAVPVEPASTLEAPLVQALRDAMSLVWRVLLAWLAVLALFVVAGWVN